MLFYKQIRRAFSIIFYNIGINHHCNELDPLNLAQLHKKDKIVNEVDELIFLPIQYHIEDVPKISLQ